MANTPQKIIKELNEDICAQDLNKETINYDLRKRKSKKKSFNKPIEYPINYRKNGKRVGGWFLSQKETYLSFLKENIKNYGGLKCKFFKSLAQKIGSRSFKQVKKFHVQLAYRFGSVEGILDNYDTKMKLQKCKPPKIQHKSNSNLEDFSQEGNNKPIGQDQVNQKIQSIKTQPQQLKSICTLKDKNVCEIQNKQVGYKAQTSEIPGTAINKGFTIMQSQNIIYPFLNAGHWLHSAPYLPQIWSCMNKGNTLFQNSDGRWLFQ